MRVERSVFCTGYETVVLPLDHSPVLEGEMGVEPILMLVTSIRLHGVKKAALREWREVRFQF